MFGIDVIRADGTRVSVQEFLAQSNLGSVLELLARSGNYEIIDPEKVSDQTNLVQGKVVNLEGQEYKIYIPQGKVDFCLGRVKGGINEVKSLGRLNGFNKIGITSDQEVVDLLAEQPNYIDSRQYELTQYGKKFLVTRTVYYQGNTATLITAWIIDYQSNYIRLVTPIIQPWK